MPSGDLGRWQRKAQLGAELRGRAAGAPPPPPTAPCCPQASEIDERRVQSCVHFMTLKKLNRLAHIRLKKGRDQTHEVRDRGQPAQEGAAGRTELCAGCVWAAERPSRWCSPC